MKLGMAENFSNSRVDARHFDNPARSFSDSYIHIVTVAIAFPPAKSFYV